MLAWRPRNVQWCHSWSCHTVHIWYIPLVFDLTLQLPTPNPEVVSFCQTIHKVTLTSGRCRQCPFCPMFVLEMSFFLSRSVSPMSWGSRNLYSPQCKHLYPASCIVNPTPLNSRGSVMNLSWMCVTDFNSPTFCWIVIMTTSSKTHEWCKCCR